MIDMENLVREVMTEQTEDLYLGHDAASRALRAAARRRFGWSRVVLIAAVGAAIAVVGAGIAAGTGVLPWYDRQQAVASLPFFTSTDPAALPGSTVNLSVPGPESTTFEIVTNNTERVGTDQMHCMTTVVKDAQGRSQPRLSGCGGPGAYDAGAGIDVDWQAPSGVTYTVISGLTLVSTAAKVALLASNGVTATTGPVAGGYYLVYAHADFSALASLVFYDARGQVVDELPLHPHP
ncbi:MAG: hypothetical protein ABSC51_11165 [Gaiellaceae bacterium]|jgi:hypothetical protein